MKMTFRWFGSRGDSISLEKIRQIPGMTGVMGFLDYKAAGEVWNEDEIKSYIGEVHAAGLECEVIESVNVHEDIKIGLSSRDRYIENYCTTIRNLAKYGVKVIIYNFMPVLDWMRTDLCHRLDDGSTAMLYDESEIGNLTPIDIVNNMLKKSNSFSLPGYGPERMAELKSTLENYSAVTKDILRENYRYFLDAVIPVCEECGIFMANHPDDPGWDIFNLPRICHSMEDMEKIVALHPSKHHGFCLCTGSLGSAPENDIPAIIRKFGAMGRISCFHVRNVKYLGHHKFTEAPHLSRTGDLDLYEIMKAVYETCPDTHIRPDHGRMIWGETGRPGYGLYDRALGAVYLEGLWEAICKNCG